MPETTASARLDGLVPYPMSTAKVLRIAALPVFWVLTAGLMARDWARDPYVESRSRDYGHNHEGALVDGLVFTLVELAVLVAILRPWSYERSWGRALVALALLVPWAGISMISTMHAGGIVVLHFMWIALLVLDVGVTFLVSAIARYRG